MGRQGTGGYLRGLRAGGPKRGLQTTLQNEIVQEIEALIGRQAIQDLDFEALEMAARRQALQLAARALEQRLNADTSDHSDVERVCPCGAPAQYRGRHRKTFESVLGPLHLERAYYHCAKCGSGFCPRDALLQMGKFSLTPGVLRMTASVAALVSFEESSSLLREPDLPFHIPNITLHKRNVGPQAADFSVREGVVGSLCILVTADRRFNRPTLRLNCGLSLPWIGTFK